MNRRVGVALSLMMLFCVEVRAQNGTTFQDSRVRVSLEAIPDGKIVFTVQNRTGEPITAYAVGIKRKLPVTNGGLESPMYFDSVTDSAMGVTSLSQYETSTRVFGGDEVALRAVIFADGSSAGDPALVTKLIHRRDMAAQYLNDGVHLLENALKTQDPAALLQQAKARLAGLPRLSTTSDFERIRLGRRVYVDIIDNVTTGIEESQAAATRIIQDLLGRFAGQLTLVERSKPVLVGATAMNPGTEH